MNAGPAIGDAKLNPLLRHALLSVSGNNDQESFIAVVVIRSAKVLRTIAEKDELIGRVSLRVDLLQQELGAAQGFITTHRSQESLSQQKLWYLHILPRLFEVLPVGHHKAKLMVGQLGNRQ